MSIIWGSSIKPPRSGRSSKRRSRLAESEGLTMGKIASLLRFVLSEFGPLIAFWILMATLGVKIAIAGSLIVILFDAAWRRRRNVSFTRLYRLTSGLTLVFGAIDLMSTTPFMLQYEAVITNMATGAAFAIG